MKPSFTLARRAPWTVLCGAVLAFALSARLSAASWTLATSPTNETLWGVTWGAGTYVAVGEHGTLLTSANSTTWQAADSGTTRWLLSVAWSPTLRLFVTVGDAGIVLTSPDGLAWTARFSGTTERLNAVAWGTGVFLAVGEYGTALTSPDGVTWTPRTTGDSGWLRGLAYGNGRFVVSGHDGTILTTADAGSSFQRQLIATHEGLTALTFADGCFVAYWRGPCRATSTDGRFWAIARYASAPTVGLAAATSAGATDFAVGDAGTLFPASNFGEACNWRGATSSADRFVVVGTGGGIISAPLTFNTDGVQVGMTVQRDHPVSPFDNLAVLPGDSATLHVSVFGAQPATWRWLFNGQPISGATAAALTLNSFSSSAAGRYSAVVTTADGQTLTSQETSLVLAADIPTSGLVDESFHPSLPTRPDAVCPLPDGRLYVAASQAFFGDAARPRHALARLLIDGQLDPSFDPGDAIDYDDTVTQLLLAPDGKLVARLSHLDPDGRTSRKLLRFAADGSLDASFQPDPLLRDAARVPVLLRDGRWLVVAPTTDSAGNRTLTVSRFSSDGRADLTFAPASAAFDAPTTTADATFYTGAVTTTDADGRLFVAVNYGYLDLYGLAGDASGHGLLFRLNADGSPDHGFNVRSFDEITFLAATSRGVIVSTTRYSTWIGGSSTTSTFRLHPDGTDDPSFTTITGGHPFFALYPGYANHVEFAALADGSLLTQEDTLHHGLVRFDAEGVRDRDFSAEHPPASRGFIPLSNGQILVTADHSLYRLTPERHAARTRLTNLSVRAAHGTGEAGLIAGFVIQGGSKQILARAIGPRLADYHVSGWLPDPTLKLVHAGTTLLANNDWTESGSVYLAKTFARLGAFPLVAGSRDSAALGDIPAGPCTMEISDITGATGIVLGELYDGDDAPTDASAPRLVNLSARARAGTGDDSLIVGFSVAGDSVRRLLLRAVGAPLANYGVTAPLLTDPTLTLCRADGSTITTAARFQSSIPAAMTVRDCAALAGAFPLSLGFNNGTAQLVVTLPAGNYTAVVGSTSQAGGLVLLEIYELP